MKYLTYTTIGLWWVLRPFLLIAALVLGFYGLAWASDNHPTILGVILAIILIPLVLFGFYKIGEEIVTEKKEETEEIDYVS